MKERTALRLCCAGKCTLGTPTSTPTVLFSWLALVGTTALVWIGILPRFWGIWWIWALFGTTFVMTAVLMLMLNVTDPGILPRGSWVEATNTPSDEHLLEIRGVGVRICRTCGIVRPVKSHHCSTCNHCIQNFDHHCVFVGHCIGRRNHKLFLFFGIILSLHTCLAASLSLVHLVIYLQDSHLSVSLLWWKWAALGASWILIALFFRVCKCFPGKTVLVIVVAVLAEISLFVGIEGWFEATFYDHAFSILALPVLIGLSILFIGFFSFHCCIVARHSSTKEFLKRQRGDKTSKWNNCRSFWCSDIPPSYLMKYYPVINSL